MTSIPTGSELDKAATSVPSGSLPPLRVRSLPIAPAFRKIVGPSVILLALAIGSGEYIIWPFIGTQNGTGILWLAAVALITQYFVVMEIERYTLATGETAITGFTRLWRGFGPVFVVLILLPYIWPGWAAGAATMLSFVVGGGNLTYMTLGILVGGAALLTLSPVVYRMVERMQFVLMGLVVVFLVAATVMATEAEAWKGVVQPTMPDFGGAMTVAVLVGAIAFAGAGAGNLAQSHWIRDKGLGMGSYIPRVVSPLTGQEISAPTTGYMFPQDKENLSRWKVWWRLANIEQLSTNIFIGLASIIVFTVLAVSTLGVGGDYVGDFTFISDEANALDSVMGSGFGSFFLIAGFAALFSTSITQVDFVGRLVSDVLKINVLRENDRWSESKLYFVTVWAFTVFCVAVILAGLEQPLLLLVISSVFQAIVLAASAVMLVFLNRRQLPDAIKIRGIRLWMVVWAAIFFGLGSGYVAITQVGKLLG